MAHPKLYRQRFIPKENIYLKNDLITYHDEDYIITKWDTLKPRNDFKKGISCYFLKEGYKVSNFMDDAGNTVYIYCDIIETDYNEKENSYTFKDLLADVIIYNDGFVKVMDIGEIPEALEKDLITVHQANTALKNLDKLLQLIYKNKLSTLTEILTKYDSF